MDEAEWLRSDYPYSMLLHVWQNSAVARTRAGRRRLRLFCCACVRRVWHLVDKPGQALVEVGERAADGLVDREELLRAEREAGVGQHTTVVTSAVWSTVATTSLAMRAFHASSNCAGALVWEDSVKRGGGGVPLDRESWQRIQQEEFGRQAELLRDIFGNPFRPPAKRKFPAEVRGLARACYDGDRAAYPLLADALVDLGEEEAAEHCRRGDHVKGCHVVDRVLGLA